MEPKTKKVEKKSKQEKKRIYSEVSVNSLRIHEVSPEER